MRLNPNYYTSSEKRTYLFIAIVLICVSSVRLYIHSVPIHRQSNFSKIVPELQTDKVTNNSNQSIQKESLPKKQPSAKQITTAYLQHAYPFDPNNIDELELQKMKFPVKGIKNLLKYRAKGGSIKTCLLYTSPSPRDATLSRMPSSA